MARVTHFDISAEEPKKLIPFYEKIFGWRFESWQGPMEYWMVSTGPEGAPGINGGLVKRQKDSNTVNTIEVDDIDGALVMVKKHGGKVLMEKGPIPHVGWFAQFQDPEKNVFGLMQPDESAR